MQKQLKRNWLDDMPDGFARLSKLHPKKIDLSLGRIERVLAALGHPERALPSVIHVAGTNGKGSVIAFLRALIETAGGKAHIYTSPHLIRFHERIVVAGEEISDEAFAHKVAQVEEANAGQPLTFFEAMTAAAFLAFSETHADFCLLETGLGGRLDATNVIAQPIMTIITSISYDHQAFLGDHLAQIAAEKAGIIKPNTPLVLAAQVKEAFDVIEARAHQCSSQLFYQGRDWHFQQCADGFVYQGQNIEFLLPLPALLGAHQMDNAAAAITAMCFLKPEFSEALIGESLQKVRWPARLQKIPADLFGIGLPCETEIFLDGGHNPAAGERLADFLRQKKNKDRRDVFLICAMRQTKNMEDFIKNFQSIIDGLYALPLPLHGQVPGEGAGAYDPEDMIGLAENFDIQGVACENLFDALSKISEQDRTGKTAPLILIAGSLLLAGDVLAEVKEIPQAIRPARL